MTSIDANSKFIQNSSPSQQLLTNMLLLSKENEGNGSCSCRSFCLSFDIHTDDDIIETQIEYDDKSRQFLTKLVNKNCGTFHDADTSKVTWGPFNLH